MTPNIQFNRGAIDAGGAVSQAWELVKLNYGLFLGVSLLALVLSGCIPCVSLFVMGPVLAGVYLVALKLYAGEPVEFGMMFKGFENFVPLMVIGLVQAIPEIIGQVLRFSVNLGQLGLDSQRGRPNGQFFEQTSGNPDILAGVAAGVLIVVAIVAFVFIIFAIVWKFLLIFALPLAIDRNLGAMDAMKLSAKAAGGNVGGIIVLFILEFLVGLLGMVMCGVGIFLISIPVSYAANAIAYRMVFPRINDQFNYNPPPPGSYGFNQA